MPTELQTKPVEDSVPKANNEIAVGENLNFQRKWWRFERVIWIIFVIILVCDLLGLFGRGWLSKATRTTPDNALILHYERIERASTPSVMTLEFSDSAIHDGKIRIYVSDSVVKPLGAQRIAPQPSESVIGNDGITYTFPASPSSSSRGIATVQIALEPSFPGRHPFRMQLLDAPPNDFIEATVFVVP